MLSDSAGAAEQSNGQKRKGTVSYGFPKILEDRQFVLIFGSKRPLAASGPVATANAANDSAANGIHRANNYSTDETGTYTTG